MNKILQIREKAAIAVAFVLGVYQVYTAVFGIPTVYLHRTIHLGAMLILCFLMVKPSEKHPKLRPFQIALYTLCIVAAAAYMIYGMQNYLSIQQRGGAPTQWDKVFCIVLFVLVFFACGTAAVVGCSSENGTGYLLTALAFGLVIVAMAYSIGNISGCHINPAVSIAMLVSKRMDGKDFVGYVVAQFVGAILGAAALMAAVGKESGLGANALRLCAGDFGRDVQAGIQLRSGPGDRPFPDAGAYPWHFLYRDFR